MYFSNEKPLVSILSPCYNGEEYVGRMLMSILKQSYANIEMICIDDGSTDGTKSAILSFQQLFFEKGMTLKYIYQENNGQASAINTGLKNVSGEYLSWIDCDDFLTNDSVEKKLNFLINHPDYAVVTSDLYKVSEDDIDTVIECSGTHLGDLNYQTNQFFLLLTGLSVMECHCHMIRLEYMKKVNPEMHIFECREGQNYQLLLPMYYNYKRGYINEPLAYYVIRNNSHYHKKRTLQQWFQRYRALNNMLEETFRQMGLSGREYKRYIELSVFTQELRRIEEKWHS